VDRQIYIYDEELADIITHNAKLVYNYPKAKIWNQAGVSLKNRIGADASFADKVNQALSVPNLEKYIIPADDSRPTRCIDGRITAGWEPEANKDTKLGPKIAGGTAHAALADRIVNTMDLNESIRFEEDIKGVIRRFKAIGIGFGGHIDDHQHGSNTGCGAVDNINLILDSLQNPVHQQQLRGLSKLIMGEAFDEKYLVNEVIGRMLYLDALKPSYMPKVADDPEGEFIYKQLVVKTLRDEADSNQEVVASLSGPHNEVAVILNFVPHTTFDTDRFSYDNDNLVQVFAWDIWHMYEEAERLFPYDMTHELSEQRSAVKNRLKYVTTRTLLGIATTMVLTDGSLRLITVSNAA